MRIFAYILHSYGLKYILKYRENIKFVDAVTSQLSNAVCLSHNIYNYNNANLEMSQIYTKCREVSISELHLSLMFYLLCLSIMEYLFNKCIVFYSYIKRSVIK